MAFAVVLAAILLLGWLGVKPDRRAIVALLLIGGGATFIQLRG